MATNQTSGLKAITISDYFAEEIKKAGILSAGQLRYLRMISPDGKVYLYDNYVIIPTDIQLKTSIEKTEKPFQSPEKAFLMPRCGPFTQDGRHQ